MKSGIEELACCSELIRLHESTRAVFIKLVRCFQCSKCDGRPILEPSSFEHVDSWRISCEKWEPNSEEPHSRFKLPPRIDYQFLRFLAMDEMTSPLPQAVLDAIDLHAEQGDGKSSAVLSVEDAVSDDTFDELLSTGALVDNQSHIPSVPGLNRGLLLRKVQLHQSSSASSSSLSPADVKTPSDTHGTAPCNTIWSERVHST